MWDIFESIIKYSKDKSDSNKQNLIVKFDKCIKLTQVAQKNLTMGFYWCRPKDFVSLDKKNILCFSEFKCFEEIKTLVSSNSITGEQYFVILNKLNECLNSGLLNDINSIPEFSAKAQELSINEKINYKKILEYIDYISQYWDERYVANNASSEILERNQIIKNKAQEVKNIMNNIHELLSDRYGFVENEIHQWQNSGYLNHYFWMETMKNEYKDKPVSISFFADKSPIDNVSRFGISFDINEKNLNEHPESWDLYYKYLDCPLDDNSVLKYYQEDHFNKRMDVVNLSAEELLKNIEAYKNPNKKIRLCCFIDKNEDYSNDDYEKLILQAYEQVIPFYNYVVGDSKYAYQVNDEREKWMNELKEFQKNMILYGPPGTGKTYYSTIYAVAICENKPEIIEEIENLENYEDIRKRYEVIRKKYEDLRSKGRIKFTTFHQSYGYEEFIEGIRPETENNQVKYKIKKGVFKDFCLKADDFDVLFNELLNEINAREDKKLKIPTSGASITLSVNSSGNLNFSIGEKEEKTGSITKDALKEYYYDTNNKKKYWESYYKCIINYIKKNIVVSSDEHDKPRYVFIIDEINRGNISKIFGELITLIETSKRKGEKECVTATLPYSGDEFSVPNNVYIIGTMNTADRSISLIDTALRRRFKFVEMIPDANLFNNVVIDGINIKTLIETINNRIIALYDREHTLGQAYFIDLCKDENKNIKTLGSIFENQIIPLLQEYFYDDYNKIRLILGDNGKENEDLQFIKIKKVESNLFKEKGEIPEFARERFIINNPACYKIESYKGIF